MPGLSGGILVARVRFDSAAVTTVVLDLQRPLQVLASLRGRTADECLRLLPKLFPLCGSAHALAALRAVEDAAGIAPHLGHAEARATLARADALAAHVWRIGIEWPQLTGTPTMAPLVAQARRLVGQIGTAFYPDGDWQRIGGGRLAVDAAALGRALAQLRTLRAQLDVAGALATVREPLALAMSGTGVEWHARVADSFARMAQATTGSFELLEQQLQSMFGLPILAAAEVPLSGGPGHGSGRVDTARGELRYELGIDSGRVVSCAMVAPTDRIFAADGPAAQMLHRLAHADDPLRTVRWVLAAWDPCIEVRVEAAEPG